MVQSIKKSIVMLILVATFSSCNQEPTLQTYYVDNELKPGFTSLDIPTSFLNIEETNLTEAQIQAYKSVDKLNMLAFMKTKDNIEVYKTELAKVTSIFKNTKYEELIRGGNTTDGKFVVKFLGDPERLDELILFGNSNDKGFAIVRILGDDMNANKLVKLAMSLDKNSISDTQINQFINFFK